MPSTLSFKPVSTKKLLLTASLSISLALHLAVLAIPVHQGDKTVRPNPPRLAASIKTPVEELVETTTEPLLKNTYEEEAESVEPPASPPIEAKPVEQPKATADKKAAITRPAKTPSSSKQTRPTINPQPRPQKPSSLDFYPQQAIDAGIEGTVKLLISLDRHGYIVNAEVIVSSGHRILDEAALKDVWAKKRFDDGGPRERFYDVSFKLD